MVSSLGSLAARMIGALTTGLGGGSGRVGSSMRAVLNGALGVAEGLLPRFSGIGTQVISGIISGIQGSAVSLWNTLRALASNMLNTLKGALGIQSPSRVMREEVGAQIGAGIAQGMLDSRRDVAAAAQTLAADAALTAEYGTTEVLGAAGAMVRSASTPSGMRMSRIGHVGGAGHAGGQNASEHRGAAVLGGNTFMFQKPVETPYRHAQAIRETMEELLYGI